MKLIRSFLGAFFGAALAIWPAATWNEAWLLLIGGVAGWLIGYHGDRFGRSFARGWRQARRVGFEAYLRAAAEKNALMAGTILLMRRIVTGLGSCARFIWSILSIEVPLRRWSAATAKWGRDTFSNVLLFPKGFVGWYGEHPMNRAAVIRGFAGLVSASLFIAVMWQLLGANIMPEVGSLRADMENNKRVIVTESYVFWNTFGLTVFFGLFPALIATILCQEERFSMKGFYRIWERYSARGPVLFAVGEAVRFLWIEVWLVWTAVSILGGAVMLYMFLMMLSLFVWFGVVYGLKLAWRAVRLNRDYGVVSLGIALLTGTITFFVFREELVANAWFRLGASLAAGFIAGAISFLVTGFCGLLFRYSIKARRIAIRRHSLTWDRFENGLIELLPDWYWKQNKRLLPALG